MGLPRTYTTDEVAEILRVDRHRVRRMVRRGELVAVNIGTPRKPEYRVTAKALDRFLRFRATAPGEVA